VRCRLGRSHEKREEKKTDQRERENQGIVWGKETSNYEVYVQQDGSQGGNKCEKEKKGKYTIPTKV
jgi:hypothetical protein